MKKLFSIVLIVILAAFALAACNGQQSATTTPSPSNVTCYVDGASASAIPAKGNYVVYATTPDDASKWTSWDYDNWCIKNEDSSVNYSVYFFSVDALFPSAEALEEATGLTAGMKVGISSYHAGVGRGASVYEVVTTEPEHRGKISLKGSGAFASIIPFNVNGEKIVTVDQFGAYGDGVKGDENRINRAFAYPDATVIEFESATYLQKNGLELTRGNVYINGKGAVISNEYRIVNNVDFAITGSKNSYLQNIRIEYLTLNCTEETGEGALSHKADHNQLDATYINGLTIKYCNFLVPFYEGILDRHVTSVCIRTSDNTVFENNTIKNLCGTTAYSGGLWFWGVDLGGGKYTSSNNISVKNNYIEKSSHDETFAFFMGDFNNVVIQNNTIYSHDEPVGDASAHAIGFGVTGIYSTMRNVDFSNNKIDVVVWADAIVMANIEGMKIYNNEITLRYNSIDQPILYGVFRVSEPDIRRQSDVEIYNNTIKAYNKRDIPLTVNCYNGFNVHDNDYECIIVK